MYNEFFHGAYKILLEEHIPFEIVHHLNLEEKIKDGLKVLIIPNAACVNEAEAEAIRSFVKKGGSIVVTYETSLYDELGNKRHDFLIADVLGARYGIDTGFYQDFIQISGDHPITEGLSREVPIQHIGAQIQVKPHEGTEVLGHIVMPYWKLDVEDRDTGWTHPPGIPTDNPSIVLNTYGKGKAVYFPSRIDAVYAANNNPDSRKLLANAVRWAAGDPLLKIEAPSCIETTLYQQANKSRTIVHLVNAQPTEDTIPVLDIRVHWRCSKQIASVYLAPERSELDIQKSGDIVSVTVPRVDYHAMVVFDHA
jgi:hypothetical protein